MSEIHPAVEAENVKARETEQEQQTREAELLENAHRVTEFFARKKRNKAIKALVVRQVIALAAIFGLMLATDAQLISWKLSVPLECGILCWAAMWFGAWLQFMFADGGLFDVKK